MSDGNWVEVMSIKTSDPIIFMGCKTCHIQHKADDLNEDLVCDRCVENPGWADDLVWEG